ncbi:hypothetical protein ANDA3_0804 [plant metagenome]|uniref:Uncharacterized protein n=1 Tax=plant metagenome TaxID=1297885 RepID=A0A484UAP3_9ZZZZ
MQGLVHETRPDKDGVEHAEIPFATPGGTDEVYALPTQAIPIIFLPGIMGSPLITTVRENRRMFLGQGHWAWRPDYSYTWMLTGFWRLGAADRRQLLNPKAVRPLEPEDADMDLLEDEDIVFGLSAQEAARRGWGSTMVSSYAPIMSYLENNLRRIMQRGKISDSTESVRPAAPAEWGTLHGYERLTDEEIEQAAEWRFPVYAVGYNWLASNKEGAEYVKRRVDAIRQDCRVRLGLQCDKVIFVTHSMGGFIARSYAQSYPDDVQGIVHGVQPAVGAPAAYARVRTGWEAPGFRITQFGASSEALVSSWILGANGTEVSAIFANAPGPLELLPNRQYGPDWIVVESGEGRAKRTLFSVPAQDPYVEIYGRHDVWWRLMNPRAINPSDPTQQGVTAAWGDYLEQLTTARAFHEELGAYYHPMTYAHCGSDVHQKAWRRVTWSLQPLREVSTGVLNRTPQAEGVRNARLMLDGMKGHCEIFDSSTAGDVMVNRNGQGVIRRSTGSSYRAWLGPPDGPGDATVPAHSGVAPRQHASFFAQMQGFDHQGSYKDPQVQQVTLYSVLKIAAKAQSLQ